MPQEDEYRLAYEIRDKKAHILVYEPIITKEERDRRMKEIKDAFHDFWVDYYKQKARQEREALKGAGHERMGK